MTMTMNPWRKHRPVAATLPTAAALLALLAPLSPAGAGHAASRWKSPDHWPGSVPEPDLAARWAREDAALDAYIASEVPDALEHTGSEAFDAHLRGVRAILRYWGAPRRLCDAGLFHSIYGTEGFQGFSLPLSERDAIRSLIGDEAEKLCWTFCMVDRFTVDETVFDWKAEDAADDGTERQFTFLARPELGRFPIRLNKREWLDFVELSLADWLEQVQGAAEAANERMWWGRGEAYAYRRTAFARMVEILSHERGSRLVGVVAAMHADVFGTEGNATRHLVQARTPPQSESAERAWDALRSAGEDVPLDFALRPIAGGPAICNQTDGAKKEHTNDTLLDNNNSSVYETDELLNMYLGLHFPLSLSKGHVDPIIPHNNTPVHGLRFPQRVANLLLSLNPAWTNGRALDVGCVVGGASFELARSFNRVEAFDSSENFIATAKRIQSGQEVTFGVRVEGDIAEDVSVVPEPGIGEDAMRRVNFFRGDACALSDYAEDRMGFGTFDGVIVANVPCRLPDPASVIGALPNIVNEGGVVVIVTPFTWSEDFTAMSKWLGGYIDPAYRQRVYSKDWLIEIMEESGFEKIHEAQMPLVIREHRRKYQYIVKETTGWRKK